jgi:hypothetical protein
MKPTGVKNNRKTAVHSHWQSHDIDRVQVYFIFIGITVLYSLSLTFSYNMHRKDWKFTLIKLGCVYTHQLRKQKVVTSRKHSFLNSHFLRVFSYKHRQARPPATVCAWGARENHVCPPLAHFYDWESWGKKGGGGRRRFFRPHHRQTLSRVVASSSSHTVEKNRRQAQSTVRESNLPKTSTGAAAI